MGLRAAVLEILYTANTQDVERGEREVKASADRIEKKPIKKKIDVDSKSALADMDRVEKEAKKLVSADTAIKLDADISRAEKSLERAKQRLQDLEVRALGGLDVTADTKRAEANLSKIERNLKALTSARSMIEVDADTTPTENAFRKAARTAGESGEDAGDRFGVNIVAALATIPIAGTLIGVGKAAADALVDAFQDGLQQEVGRDRLQALTGIDAPDAARLARIAGEAYASNFGESVEANMDTARLALQFDLIDADSAQRESQRVIQGLAGISDVLGEDVRPIATVVATLLRTGLAKSADEAFDILATGAREGVNRGEDLLDTFTEYPVVLARLGLSGEQSLGLLNQALSAGARNSDVAADALKEFQIRATDGSTASAEGFRLLGLSASEMTAQIARGGDDAREGLDVVLDRLRAMQDPVAQNAAAVALFGTKAEDLGEALFAMDLSTAVEQLNGVTGAAQRMFDTLADNDASNIETARRNIEVAMDGIKGALAAGLSEPLGDFADWVAQNRGPLTEFLLGLANGALDFGRSVVNASADGTIALGEFVAGPLRETVQGLRDFLEWLPGDSDLSGLDSLIASMDGFDESTATAAERMRTELTGGIDEAQARMNAWADPIVQMGYLNDATLRVADAVALVGTNADGAIMGLDGINTSQLSATDSGMALEGQIRRALLALDDEVTAASRAGESQDELAARYRTGTEALGEQLQQMGLTEEQAQSLIDTVLRTPATSTTQYDSNARAERERVQGLADRITTLPDGSVVITANTDPAQAEIDTLWRRNNGRVIRMQVQAGQVGVGGGAGPISIRQELGGIVEFMAEGGLRGLTPMAPIAQMVPQNTWRVVGDRTDVAEAYIPLDGSARSMAILAEVMRRMGLAPMAAGAVTGAPTSRGSAADGPVVIHLIDAQGRLLGIFDGAVQRALSGESRRVRAGTKGRYG